MDQAALVCAKCSGRFANNSTDALSVNRTQYCTRCNLLPRRVILPSAKTVEINKLKASLASQATDQLKKQLGEKNFELKKLKSSLKSLRLETDECQKQLVVKNTKLESLNTRLEFLLLGSVGDQPDDIPHSDVVIIVQGRADEFLHAHKCILARKSPVFRTMFNVDMSEEATGMIQIDDATLPIIRAMINFCYNAEIDFTDEVTAEELLKVAHKYQINALQSLCQGDLIKTIDDRNLAKRFRLAKRFCDPGLEAAATKYLKSHYDQAIGDVMEELC